MARAIWTGSISFGLLNVPVKLYSAVSRKSVSFRELRASDSSRIRHKRVAESDGEEVPYEEIVKGYEVAPEHYVVLTREELEALDLMAALEESLAAIQGEPLAAGSKRDGKRDGAKGRKRTAAAKSRSSSKSSKAG